MNGTLSRCIIDAANRAQARDAAWERYWNTPHADPRVGREKYRAEIARINGEGL